MTLPPVVHHPVCNTRIVTWAEAEHVLRAVRTAVFIREQGIPEVLEWDGKDPQAVHVLATDSNDTATGTARLLVQGDRAQIGRVAVVAQWRRKGVGRSLVYALMREAGRRGAHEVFLHAQTSAIPFYEICGFVAEGEQFMEDGLPHYRMTSNL